MEQIKRPLGITILGVVRLASSLICIIGGVMILLTPRPTTTLPAPADGEHRYLPHELIGQVGRVGGFQIVSDPRRDRADLPIILVARREPAAVASAA